MKTLILSMLLVSACLAGEPKAEVVEITNTAAAAPKNETPKDVVFSQYRLIISVEFDTKEGKHVIANTATGTAVAISKRNIITAGHGKIMARQGIPEGLGTIHYYLQVFDKDGIMIRQMQATNKQEQFDEESGMDLMELTVEEDLPHHVEIDGKATNDLGIADWLYAIGSAGGASPYNITWGQLSSKWSETHILLWQSSVPVVTGNSGGGIYRAKDNKLVGIMVRGQGTISFFLPVDVIARFLK